MSRMTLKDLCSVLQTCANNGFAIHNVEVHASCKNCNGTIMITDPELDLILDDKAKTVALRFLHGDCE